jgi:hypothetical protein
VILYSDGWTAEGVETEEQLVSLKKVRCQRAQGFYLARPMPAVDLDRLIAESHRWQSANPAGGLPATRPLCSWGPVRIYFVGGWSPEMFVAPSIPSRVLISMSR